MYKTLWKLYCLYYIGILSELRQNYFLSARRMWVKLIGLLTLLSVADMDIDYWKTLGNDLGAGRQTTALSGSRLLMIPVSHLVWNLLSTIQWNQHQSYFSPATLTRHKFGSLLNRISNIIVPSTTIKVLAKSAKSFLIPTRHVSSFLVLYTLHVSFTALETHKVPTFLVDCQSKLFKRAKQYCKTIWHPSHILK